MKLPYQQKLSNKDLLDQAGITDAAKSDLVRYLGYYGLDLDEFSDRVRDCLKNGMTHHDRLAFCDAIAECLGRNLRLPKDRDAFWKEVVEGGNPDRGYGVQWKTGLEDMPLDELNAYAAFCLDDEKFKEPVLGGRTPITKLGIARSLVYIRVHPPKAEKRRGDLPDGNDLPEELEGCWKELRKHPHYRNSKPPSLNQHALDSIADRYQKLWIEPHEIGRLKNAIEADPYDPSLNFWFWPFVLFKYATRCKIISRNQNTLNIYKSLWNPTNRFAREVWA